MLEGALKSWIYYFLGKYVESQTVQVSAKFWKSSERLKLENLTLKESIIPSWLPFRLKAGFIGQFEADLPFSAIFGSSAAKIKFVDVLLVLEPLTHDEDGQRQEISTLIETKMQMLEQDLLHRWNGPDVPELPTDNDGYFGTDGWIGRTMTKLIDNLQIDIRNLQIRIEGTWSPTQGMGSSSTSASFRSTDHATESFFAGGITVGYLSAVTTPSTWVVEGEESSGQKADDDQSHLVFKLVNAVDVSAYIDPHTECFIDPGAEQSKVKEALAQLKEMGTKQRDIPEPSAEQETQDTEGNIEDNRRRKIESRHRFLVSPISISLKLKMNTAAQHAQTEDPRYHASFFLSRVLLSLDEEQLSILKMMIDSSMHHEEWRTAISEQVKHSERQAAHDSAKGRHAAEEYVELWKRNMAWKSEGLDELKNEECWTRATTIEEHWPYEFIVSLRNQAGLETATGAPNRHTSLWHELSHAVDIPLPEVSVWIPSGPCGLELELTPDGNVMVTNWTDECPQNLKDAIRPGMLLTKIDSKALESVLSVSSASDVEVELNSMPDPHVLTFRHQSLSEPNVTPDHAVAWVEIESEEIKFQLVRAQKEQVLADVVLTSPLVTISGFGPGLFAYHRYGISIEDFYIRNAIASDVTGYHCIASSVARRVLDTKEEGKPSLRLEFDYLYAGHPESTRNDVTSFGSKILFDLGNSILVFDETLMTKLIYACHDFVNAIASPDVHGDCTTFDSVRSAPFLDAASNNSTRPSSLNTIGEEDEGKTEDESTKCTYEVNLSHLRLFMSAAKGVSNDVPNPARQSSYPRLLLKQLVSKSKMASVDGSDWRQAAQAIVVLQRYVRGALVRRRRMIRLALAPNRWVYYSGDEMMGWLYVRDDLLAFRRWYRAWCCLDSDGIFAIYDNGSGANCLDIFHVKDCNMIYRPDSATGPFKRSDAMKCDVMEVVTSEGASRKVLASDVTGEMLKWKNAMEKNARRNAERWKKQSGRLTAAAQRVDKIQNNSDKRLNEKERFAGLPWGMISDEILLGGFSDEYRPYRLLKHEKSNWMMLSVTDFSFSWDLHQGPDQYQSAFHAAISANYVSIRDYRKATNHGLLHVGDAFLTLQNGLLRPAKLHSEQLVKGPFLKLEAWYRGTQAAVTWPGKREGLTVNMSISGWAMPLNLLELIFDAIEVLDILWTLPEQEKEEASSNRQTNTGDQYVGRQSTPQPVGPAYLVPTLRIQIDAPMLEAYVEDTHCVAKLSVEQSQIKYNADADSETVNIYVGPTALFVLTDDVALRLAQVASFGTTYELRLHHSTEQYEGCKLCRTAVSKRHAQRAFNVTIGQVKLEADRRLELLYALLGALATSNSDVLSEEDIDERVSEPDENAADKPREQTHASASASAMRSAKSDSLLDHQHADRIRSMQSGFSDKESSDLQAPAIGFSRTFAAPSPATRSRGSGATSNGGDAGFRSSGFERNRGLQRQAYLWLSPLLTYQTYISVIGDVNDRSARRPTLFRQRLRIGRVTDKFSASCSSVVFEVIKRSLSVVALDTYIPVMNLSVSDMKLQALTGTEFEYDYQVDAKLQISARYYNTTLADWEPFVEPWLAYAKASRHHEEGRPGVSVELNAMQRLNLNITNALVRLATSVTKSRNKHIYYAEKRSLLAAATDAEAKKEDGRVSVLNNLGVPIRLANLNTSRAGTLRVEIRDGWGFPTYNRFHDVRVEVALLPWWHPCEVQQLENLAHTFELPYSGAQSGVTPILRIDVASADESRGQYVFDHVANKYVEADDADVEDTEDGSTFSMPVFQPASGRGTRGDSVALPHTKWSSVGTTEVNLARGVMGTRGEEISKINRWYRLHDSRGTPTGEIFVALQFIPHNAPESSRSTESDSDHVQDGRTLIFDPLKIATAKDPRSTNSNQLRQDSETQASHERIVLSEGLRTSYIPPLALEVMIGTKRCSLLCPMRRAGKFLVQGEGVLAEVKVAQRDEFRRVLVLNSPVQLKNGTSIDMKLWTSKKRAQPGDNGPLPPSIEPMQLSSKNKVSVPLSALYGGSTQSLVVKVDGCKPTAVTNMAEIAAGSFVLILSPEEEGGRGYCLFIKIISFMRKVYREEQQATITRGNGADHDELQSYATKYQVCFHSCLVFENTLPLRVLYKIIATGTSGSYEYELASGTLVPGEEVLLHEFQKEAQLILRLPEINSQWSDAISLSDCIYRDGMGKAVQTILGARAYQVPFIQFYPRSGGSNVELEAEFEERNKVTARIEYTTTAYGNPRVVIYSQLWIFNQSHLRTLLVRDAEVPNPHILNIPQIIPQRPVPQLMDCPEQAFEISTIVEQEVSGWSDKIHSNVVGVQAPVGLKFRAGSMGPWSKKEIGISIQRPLGKFHRTTQVVVTSRLVFVNKVEWGIKISQHARDHNVLELEPASGDTPTPAPFDFDTSGRTTKRQVYLSLSQGGEAWSGPFTVDEEKEFPLRLRVSAGGWKEKFDGEYARDGLQRSDINVYRIRVRISSVGPTMVVTLMQDDPPMYIICNESDYDLFVNEAESSNCVYPVRSREFIPFAWSKPDRLRRVNCRYGEQGSTYSSSLAVRVYDFDDLDREKGHEEFITKYGNANQAVSAHIVVSRSSRLLIFQNHDHTKVPRYVLEVKVIAARMKRDYANREEVGSAYCIAATDTGRPKKVESEKQKRAHVYRFDSEILAFSEENRPRKLALALFNPSKKKQTVNETDVAAIDINDNMISVPAGGSSPPSPMGGDTSGPFNGMETPEASPLSHPRHILHSSSLPRHRGFYENEDELSDANYPVQLSDVQRISHSDALSDLSDDDSKGDPSANKPSGVLEIKIPKKAWTYLGVGARHSSSWSINGAERGLQPLGRMEGHWWDLRDPDSGELVGEVQVALNFRTSDRPQAQASETLEVRVSVPSVGVSFLHNSNSTMVEVAYWSMQRLKLLYSRVDKNSEAVVSIGNMQMDNQMDAEVVLGPRVHRVKEGVSVRLRDRWQSFLNYKYRGIFEQLDTANYDVIHFQMLWNGNNDPGEVRHFELIQLDIQELEISTDEKFVVNLISVFQELEWLSSNYDFKEVVDTQLDYTGASVKGASDGDGNTPDGFYIEELDIEPIRIKFSMELNGGRHIQTLGPSVRRFAVYLPETNVKDFRLYLTRLAFAHLYETQASLTAKLMRRYQQQAVILVLRGLHTVSGYANPFRFVYRLGHGLVEIVRLPARGLASGSPVELLTGAYLGVRSLVMNVISASYEMVAGGTAIMTAVAGPLVPDTRRKAFEEDMIGFQRAVIEEVSTFDAAEERTMTKVIIRKPREFDPAGVGLVTVYGPGSMPMEEQDRIDHHAVLLVQHWWRRRRLAYVLYSEALRLRPEIGQMEARLAHRIECLVQ